MSDLLRSPYRLTDPGRDSGRVAQGLQHNTVALGQFQQRVDPILRLVRSESKSETYLAEANRCRAVYSECAAEIEVTLSMHLATVQMKVESRRDCFQRDAGTGDQRLQQHVTRAGLQSAAARRRVQAGLYERAPGANFAGDTVSIEVALCLRVTSAASGLS